MNRYIETVCIAGFFRGRVMERHDDGETDERYETRAYPTEADARKDAQRYLEKGKPSPGSVEAVSSGQWCFH